MPSKSGTCILCGKIKELTFEHVPPSGAGENKPAKLYNLLDTLGNEERVPWDFKDLKYVQSQRGTGGYYLCSECNSRTGREYVPSFIEFIKQAKDLNIQAVKPECAKRMYWDLTFSNISTLNISKQIILMISCMNGRSFLKNNIVIDRFLNDKNYKIVNPDFGLYIYINAGLISLSYPTTAFAGTNILTNKHHVIATSGVNTGIFSFQYELKSHVNKDGYYDITNWVTHNDFDQKIDVKMRVPVMETNIGLPGNHNSINEMLNARNSRK